ncbi:MAG: hypothetical protein NUW01_01640 [Gemmatimonadaceae bacterium]|nr:hypothetical protein [Gemmatimonadaceae bacterium]
MAVHAYSPPRYKTDRERLAARRATSLRSQHRRYKAYRELCAELGLSVTRRWTTHYRELRLAADWAAGSGVALTAAHRWWLARYSRDEIRVLGRFADGALRATKEV